MCLQLSNFRNRFKVIGRSGPLGDLGDLGDLAHEGRPRQG